MRRNCHCHWCNWPRCLAIERPSGNFRNLRIQHKKVVPTKANKAPWIYRAICRQHLLAATHNYNTLIPAHLQQVQQLGRQLRSFTQATTRLMKSLQTRQSKVQRATGKTTTTIPTPVLSRSLATAGATTGQLPTTCHLSHQPAFPL